VLTDFISYAREKGVPEVYSEIKTSEEILKIQIYANITRNILDNKGFYPIIKSIDNTLKKAIEVLENNPA
ncbi:MAG: peptidase S41, partial [Bacteroidales bacterium]